VIRRSLSAVAAACRLTLYRPLFSIGRSRNGTFRASRQTPGEPSQSIQTKASIARLSQSVGVRQQSRGSVVNRAGSRTFDSQRHEDLHGKSDIRQEGHACLSRCAGSIQEGEHNMGSLWHCRSMKPSSDATTLASCGVHAVRFCTHSHVCRTAHRTLAASQPLAAAVVGRAHRAWK
jgi:hypothetical protein